MKGSYHFDLETRLAIAQSYFRGEKVNDICLRFGCHRDTPRRIAKKLIEKGTVQNLPRGKNKSKWTKKSEKFLIKAIKKNPTQSIRDLEVLLRRYLPEKDAPHRSSIQQKLKYLHFKKIFPIQRPYLTIEQKKMRLE